MAISNILFNILNGISNASDARKKLAVPHGASDDSMYVGYTDEDAPYIDHIIDANNSGRIVATNARGVYYTRKINGTWQSVPLSVDRGGTGGGNVNQALQNLNLAPISGTTFGTASGPFAMHSFGYISNAGKDAVIYMPTSLTVASSVSYSKSNVTAFVCSLRTVDGGYVGGAISTDLKNYITDISLRSHGRGFAVTLTNSSGWGITNNTPIAGSVNFGITFP